MARNSIVAKNKKVEYIMSQTTEEKGKTFDKILLTMVSNCISRLKYHEAENVIIINSVTYYGRSKSAYKEI